MPYRNMGSFVIAVLALLSYESAATGESVIEELPPLPKFEWEQSSSKADIPDDSDHFDPDKTGILAIESGGKSLLYGFARGTAHVLTLDDLKRGWVRLALTGVDTMIASSAGSAYALCRTRTGLSVHRLDGERPEAIVQRAVLPLQGWYVDGVSRVWLLGEEQLIVVSPGGAETSFISEKTKYANQVHPKPCELKPGHVTLFYNTCLIRATPGKLERGELPDFANDGTGDGPFPFGDGKLLVGGGNESGIYVIDSETHALVRKLDIPDWDHFNVLGSMRDGRAICEAWRRDSREKALLWVTPGEEQAARIGGDSRLLREDVTRKILSDGKRAVMRLRNGSLAAFVGGKAMLVRRSGRFPRYVYDVSMLGHRLFMLGEHGKVFALNLETGLLEPSVAAEEPASWGLCGPCCVDVDGRFWAFLQGDGDYLHRFDGGEWRRFPIRLGRLKPTRLTADDLGNLLIDFNYGTSCTFKDGNTRFFGNDEFGALKNSILLGATRFFNGSGMRPAHWAVGGGKAWFDDGKAFWDGKNLYRFNKPEYRFMWLDKHGKPYRTHYRDTWVYDAGRWKFTDETPEKGLIGPQGFADFDDLRLLSEPGRHVTAYLKGGESVRVGEDRKNVDWTDADLHEGDKPFRCAVDLKGGECFVPLPPDGGLLGTWRALHGVFFPIKAAGKYMDQDATRIYETPHGRFIENRGESLTLFPHRSIELVAKVVLTEKGCKVTWTALPAGTMDPKVLVMADGKPRLVDDTGEIAFDCARFSGAKMELFAVDALGNASSKPFAFTVPGAFTETDETEKPVPGPRWTRFQRRVNCGGQDYELSGSFGIDSEGRGFFAARGAQGGKYALLTMGPALRNWKVIPGAGAVTIYSSPAGRIFWSRYGQNNRDKVETPLFALQGGLEAVATRIYCEQLSGTPVVRWDRNGNLWKTGKTWVGRWDGREWRDWERLIGGAAKVLFSPGGLTYVVSANGYWVHKDNELSEGSPWPEGMKIDGCVYNEELQYAHLLGEDRLVVKGSFGQANHWVCIDASTGVVLNRTWPDSIKMQGDGNGNLFLWDYPGGTLRILSPDLSEEKDASFTVPGTIDWKMNSNGECLLLTRGCGVACHAENRGIVTWVPGSEPAVHDWREGVSHSERVSMREDRLGRIWIMQDAQLLVYDPGGNPTDEKPAFTGWRSSRVNGDPCPGFDGTIWFWREDLRSVVRTDGATETVWPAPEDSGRRFGSIVLSSDRGEAVSRSHLRPGYLHFRTGGGVDQIEDLKTMVQQMVNGGARAFHVANGTPLPVVAADGRIYFEGEIWDGGKWVKTREGSPCLDAQGNIWLMSRTDYRSPFQYRFAGARPLPEGASDRYLADRYGRRVFDPGLVEQFPGRFLVVRDIGEKTVVSLKPESPSCGIDFVSSATPDGRGGFFIDTRFEGLHHLGPEGLFRADPAQFPFGGQKPLAHLLKNAMAFAVESEIFFAPLDLRYSLLELENR